jgi:acyl-CoA reductase-like NAD-dependent aldehyde dehydrogenase
MTTLKTYNPKNGELLAELQKTSESDIKKMVTASHIAQKTWSVLSVKERGNIIVKAYDGIIAQKQELAELIHNEMGKTKVESLREVEAYAGGIKNMANELDEALASHSNTQGNITTTTLYDPLGVCASITPWNFPMGMPHTLMMPSLMAGNTVLFKPSEEVTLIGMKYAEILNKVLPKNVLQVVIGAGDEGKVLVESDVQLITFTGSQNTGKHILQSAGKDLKRVLLELGGKDPMIVLDDVDLEAAIDFAALNSFRNAGQVCVSTEQIFVTEKNHDEFLKGLIEKTKSVEIGVMINKRQQDHVIKQVKEAIEMGAVLELGSVDVDHLSPIVLSHVTPDMNIMIDETFGPVACVMKVKNPEEAIEITNRSNYGLGGVIFGKDTDKAYEYATQLKIGMVGINKACSGVKGSPWVGYGQSGYGFHGSVAGHRQFTQVRIVSVVN